MDIIALTLFWMGLIILLGWLGCFVVAGIGLLLPNKPFQPPTIFVVSDMYLLVMVFLFFVAAAVAKFLAM